MDKSFLIWRYEDNVMGIIVEVVKFFPMDWYSPRYFREPMIKRGGIREIMFLIIWKKNSYSILRLFFYILNEVNHSWRQIGQGQGCLSWVFEYVS